MVDNSGKFAVITKSRISIPIDSYCPNSNLVLPPKVRTCSTNMEPIPP